MRPTLFKTSGGGIPCRRSGRRNVNRGPLVPQASPEVGRDARRKATSLHFGPLGAELSTVVDTAWLRESVFRPFRGRLGASEGPGRAGRKVSLGRPCPRPGRDQATTWRRGCLDGRFRTAGFELLRVGRDDEGAGQTPPAPQGKKHWALVESSAAPGSLFSEMTIGPRLDEDRRVLLQGHAAPAQVELTEAKRGLETGPPRLEGEALSLRPAEGLRTTTLAPAARSPQATRRLTTPRRRPSPPNRDLGTTGPAGGRSARRGRVS
jgi:hypothetical protein